MKGLQIKINKLSKAFEMKNYVVFVNSVQNYSSEAKKTFTFYSVTITTPENIEYRRGLRFERNVIKETIKKLEKNLDFCESKDASIDIKSQIRKLEKDLRDVNVELRFSAPPRWEFPSKIKILLLLVEMYKKVCERELRKNERK